MSSHAEHTTPLLSHNEYMEPGCAGHATYPRFQTLIDILNPQTTSPIRYQPLPGTFLYTPQSYIVVHIHYYVSVQEAPPPSMHTPIVVKYLVYKVALRVWLSIQGGHICPLPSAVINSLASNWHCLRVPTLTPSQMRWAVLEPAENWITNSPI